MARPGRLVTRVVLATVASAALGGSLAAIVAVVGVDRLVENHHDRQLTGAAINLAAELDEDRDEGEQESVREVLEDENEELLPSGIRLAAFRGRWRVAGDSRVPWVPPEHCETHGVVGQRVRTCGHEHGDLVLLASHASDQAALRWLYLLAALGALVIGGGAGAAASLLLTRWALRPLTALTEALRAMPPAAAKSRDLGPPSSCEEIEAIRVALSDLIGRIDVLLSQAQRFAADAAHELRTPLTTIGGELDLLLEDGGKRPEGPALRRVRDRTARLAELVERLLLLAAPLTEQRHRFEAVALADVLTELVNDLPETQRDRVRLSLPDEGLTRGEPSLLRSMFSNAILNALKFSGDRPIDVELVETPERGLVRVDVRDRGPGVAPELRQRVFEPFYRSDPQASPGLGLGLSLIGHIARAHGGSAEFVDAAEGACLRLLLPSWLPRSAEPTDPAAATGR